MLMFSNLNRSTGLTPFDGPLSPAAYLKLRRLAAGLTVEGLAELIAPRHTDRSEARALVRCLETEGVRARNRETIDLLADHFRIDPDVYHQLATEPPSRHPLICRGCGCSEYDPCSGPKGVCGWASLRACTRCADRGLVAVGAE